jgi:S-adenosyl methyltransferase
MPQLRSSIVSETGFARPGDRAAGGGPGGRKDKRNAQARPDYLGSCGHALRDADSADISTLRWDYFSWAPAAGVEKLQSALGISSPSGSLSLGQVVFEPEALRVSVGDAARRDDDAGRDMTRGRAMAELPPEIETSRPDPARIYDYAFGGKNHFAADREVADRALASVPAGRTAARENRAFLGWAVPAMSRPTCVTRRRSSATRSPVRPST